MNTIQAIAVATSLAFSAGAMAQTMSKDQHKAAEKNIMAEYKVAKTSCDSFAGNTKDICVAEAKGKEKIAKAELEAQYNPSEKNRYKARVAKAEAEYAVAMEKCDDQNGNAKDVCVKQAKAAKVAAKADAKAQKKTAAANETADEKSAKAQRKANDENADTNKDAASDKRDANYTVAKEKCDAFAGDEKANCIKQAKARFGKS